MARPVSTNQISCSFCGKSKDDVSKLIAGPTVFICNECVELCQDILTEEPLDGALDTRSEIRSPRTPLRILDRAAASRAHEQHSCGKCEKMCKLDMLVFAAADTATPAKSDSVSHTITAEEMQGAPRPLCLACTQELILSSLEKRECALCHQSRLVREFPDSELRVCIRCAQTAKWLLENRDSEPDVLMAMRALLDNGMHVLFDRVVSAAKSGYLSRTEFEGAALLALRRAGLIHKNFFVVPATAIGFIADSCHSDGVWLRIVSNRVPEANSQFTAPVL